MELIKKKALNKAIGMLNILHVPYYIKTEDGKVFSSGDFHVEDAKKKKKRYSFKRGVYSDYLDSFHIKDMEVGDIVSVPCGQFTHDKLSQNIRAYAKRAWGKSGSAMVVGNKNGVEVMRLEDKNEEDK